jgi:hypothetical protein
MHIIKYLARRICCICGVHTWGGWRYHVYNPGFYDQELWKTRVCKYCPKITEDFMSDNERIYLNEILAGKRKCMP